eukprot:GHRR01036336.1.p1 GENE.GHRR01036336.1~~GHRR01036336.1.p1  ORF type:complete len:118 (-),score=28.47 GHRR01036336.1:283-636(-)
MQQIFCVLMPASKVLIRNGCSVQAADAFGLAAMLACAACAGVVDAVLIPEVPFTLYGDKGLFKYLEGVIANKGHCVVCVAEGAGQVWLFAGWAGQFSAIMLSCMVNVCILARPACCC